MENKGTNVFIEFSIIQNSELDAVKKELELLISFGKLIYLWSKTTTPTEMLDWITNNNLKDYIWGYRVKDSTHYSSPDFVIDNNKAFVERFRRNNISGNVLSNL